MVERDWQHCQYPQPFPVDSALSPSPPHTHSHTYTAWVRVSAAKLWLPTSNWQFWPTCVCRQMWFESFPLAQQIKTSKRETSIKFYLYRMHLKMKIQLSVLVCVCVCVTHTWNFHLSQMLIKLAFIARFSQWKCKLKLISGARWVCLTSGKMQLSCPLADADKLHSIAGTCVTSQPLPGHAH